MKTLIRRAQSSVLNRSQVEQAKANPPTGATPRSFSGAFALRFSAALLAAWLCGPVEAFPPAPHHMIYGNVRDEMGNPLSVENAVVIFETPSGALITTEVVYGMQPGINYRLAVPLDAGVTSDAYRSIALHGGVPFTMRVKIGRTSYLPIEMSGEFSSLGQPAGSTQLNLTLGEDSNGNGLPDAWERALIAASGGNLTEIDPGDDLDNDGLTNLQEYQAGTFAFDINDGFSLRVVEANADVVDLEFMSVRGRVYTVFASSNLKDWELVPFQFTGGKTTVWNRYQADDTKVVQITIRSSPDLPVLRFFKLRAE